MSNKTNAIFIFESKSVVLFFIFLTFSLASAQILKRPIPDKLVVLTFDDAPVSHYSIVAPLLKKHDFKATFFVCEFPPNFSDNSKYMNWAQIKKLDKMGFEIGNHTQSHKHVNKLSKENFIQQLQYIEIGNHTQSHKHVNKLSKENFIQQLQYIENKCDSLKIKKPLTFAYPGYDYSLNAITTLQEQSYILARAGGSRAYNPLEDNPFLIPSWATNANNKEEIMAAFQEAKNGKIVVLTIHGVPDIEHPWVNTPAELFKEYLDYLAKNNFKVIALKDLNKYINFKKAAKTIAIDTSKKYKN
ncbi:MAG: polysaccharide deacetylase [Flavobacteriales bacterium 32-34-25]|nr:MAG: polysaccharide deacetylase [Flavobacteriales bacterium 32-34-25]